MVCCRETTLQAIEQMKKSAKYNKNKKVVYLLPESVSQKIEIFEKSKRFVDFLLILNELAPLSVNYDFIWDIWVKYQDEIIDDLPVQRFLQWISGIDFLTNKPVKIDHPENDHPNANISDLVQKLIEVLENEDAIIKHNKIFYYSQENPYGMFLSAWPFKDFFIDYPEIDESSKIIASYINVVFKDNSELKYDKLVVLNKYNLVDKLKKIIIPWIKIKSQSDDNFQRLYITFLILIGEMDITNILTFPDNFSVIKFAGILCSLSNPLFDRIIDIIVEQMANNDDWPNSEKQGYKELFQKLMYYNNLSPYSFDKIIFIYGLWDVADLIKDLGFDYIKSLVQKNINQFIIDRRNTTYGQSPMSYELALNMRADLSSFCFKMDLELKHDIAYLLSPTEDSENDSYGLGWFNFNAIPSESIIDFESFIEARKKNYLIVIEAALDEGWFELANACLAFFLFSQPLICKNHLCIKQDWPKFSHLLLQCSTLPGFNRVKAAAQYAINFLNLNNQSSSIDQLCLKTWAEPNVISKNDSNNIMLFNAIPEYQRIQNFLADYFGQELWLKISLLSKQKLQDAEKQWTALHEHLGRGIGDFASLAISYVKVIETELTERLKPVIQSKEFVDFARPKERDKPTLGFLLNQLKNHYQWSDSLKNMVIERGVKLHTDKQLMKNLFDIMQLRNKAAHSDSFSAQEIVELRTLLYDGQVLKRFFQMIN